MDEELTDAEFAILKAAGYHPRGGGRYNGVSKVRFARNDIDYLATRAEWRVIIADLEANERLSAVDAECKRIADARAVEALRVTAGYTTAELQAMPDQALGRALRVANAVSDLIRGPGTIAAAVGGRCVDSKFGGYDYGRHDTRGPEPRADRPLGNDGAGAAGEERAIASSTGRAARRAVWMCLL